MPLLKKYIYRFIIAFNCIFLMPPVYLKTSPVRWLRHDAEVWSRYQVVRGKLDSSLVLTGSLQWNQDIIPVTVNPDDSIFSLEIPLKPGENRFVASFDNMDKTFVSEPLILNLRLSLKPVLEAFATVQNRDVLLHGRIIENPDSTHITFSWHSDSKNPVQTPITLTSDTTAALMIPEYAKPGEYYFNLTGITKDNDTVFARTFITVDENTIKPFDIRRDHSAWIDTAVIYEITPYSFVIDGRFPDITNKLADLKDLGINTIWIQPVFRTKWGDHGYDVIDYFSVRSDYGSEDDLRELIRTAHNMNMRVIFDIVINHSSIYHRYAQHSIAYGETSHYYNFYQREEDSSPYSRHYSRYRGFINYFWDELPNLNYDNPEVQNWMLSACKYWIEEFDIDGYRFDAVWGVTARKPEFTKELRLTLKRIKPEILMLAEDKASWANVFDERFDLAFEWAPGELWVSQWYYETIYNDWWTNKQNTIFNSVSPLDRADRLRSILNNTPEGYAGNAKILRFMGNNDMIPFTRNHSLEQTKMAAALFFSLNGVPMLYNGQEIGYNTHPYSASYIFQRGKSIRSTDKTGLYDYYRYLISIRKKYPSLSSNWIRDVPVNPARYAYAYHRQSQDENLFGVINMTGESREIVLTLPLESINLDTNKIYYLSDVITGTVYSGFPGDFASANITIPGFTTFLFVLADTLTPVHINPNTVPELPGKFMLHQNFPNPFNPVTFIGFELPEQGKADLVVYDLLGKEICVLVRKHLPAGFHRVAFNGHALPSGMYIYSLQFGENIINRKMVVVK